MYISFVILIKGSKKINSQNLIVFSQYFLVSKQVVFSLSIRAKIMASVNLASSSNQIQNTLAASTNVSFTFNTPMKLDQANYLIWRSQVLASIRGNRLEKLIDDSITPPPSHIAQRVGDDVRSVENPDFISWNLMIKCCLDSCFLQWMKESSVWSSIWRHHVRFGKLLRYNLVLNPNQDFYIWDTWWIQLERMIWKSQIASLKLKIYLTIWLQQEVPWVTLT